MNIIVIIIIILTCLSTVSAASSSLTSLGIIIIIIILECMFLSPVSLAKSLTVCALLAGGAHAILYPGSGGFRAAGSDEK